MANKNRKSFFINELKVIECYDKVRKDTYYTILNWSFPNNHNLPHVHCLDMDDVEDVVDCYNSIKNYNRCSARFTHRSKVRNKALKLLFGVKTIYR